MIYTNLQVMHAPRPPKASNQPMNSSTDPASLELEMPFSLVVLMTSANGIGNEKDDGNDTCMEL